MEKSEREFYDAVSNKLDELDDVEAYRKQSRWRRRLGALPNRIWQAGIYQILAWLAWMAADRNPPVEFRTVIPRIMVVHPGDELTIDYVVDRKRVCESRTTWIFTDSIGRRFDFSGVLRNAPERIGPDRYPFASYAPSEMASGPARLRAAVSWECPSNFVHPLYPISLLFTDVLFTVTVP